MEGFTLVEVLVSISILAIGLVLVVQAMGRTQLALRLSENITRASYIAEEKIVNMELKVRDLGRASFGGESGRVEFPGRAMEWESNINHFDKVAKDDEARLNKLSVKVNWIETNRPNDLEVQTLALNRKRNETLS